jgi:hypothetical protein
MKSKIFYTALSVSVLVIISLSLVSAGFLDKLFNRNPDLAPVDITVTIADNPPNIVTIESVNEATPDASPDIVDPIADSTVDVEVSFIAEDPNGNVDLDPNSATVQFNGPAPSFATRTGLCVEAASCGSCTSLQRRYTCTVIMNYFEDAGSWGVTLGVSDFATPSPNTDTDSTKTFTYTTTVGVINDPAVSWTNLGVTTADIDQVSDGPLTLFNRGNVVLNSVDLTAFDLQDTPDGPNSIPSERFSAGPSNGPGPPPEQCDWDVGLTATQLATNGILKNIGGLSVPYGDGIGNNDEAPLHFCIWQSLNDLSLDITSTYSTTAIGGTAWSITV